MRFDCIVELIDVELTRVGNDEKTESHRKPVYAHKKSVQRSEFYAAYANNHKPTVIFVIHAFEYEDQQKLSYKGIEYLILRTFCQNAKTIELVCQVQDDIEPNVARLEHVVEIWRNTYVENSMGEQTPQPELLYTLQAKIDYTGGGTGELNGTIETTNNAVVTIVYREDIKTDMFIMIEDQRWNIEYIEDPLNRHETLLLTIERVIL
ncbi:phage head closure protein [Chengkuizengella marina]|uniref:Head-tail adaptor protein n=1 Tax=Chengkuizengella marina TaxID=2507566 RepID=A0A6N9Q833_9BACL|nr:phage head closure protein [Chengkuizengella marina]NBI31036.1 head-tail adaptor protein [Chengkuizengella marina]